MYNIGLVSLGCAKNQTDAEIMLGILANDGFNITYNPSDADVIIVNTCGFIESAKQEAIDTILEFCTLKQEGRIKAVIATGCLAERYRDEMKKEIPELDAVVGIGSNGKICDIIREILLDKQAVCSYGAKTELSMEGGRIITTEPFYEDSRGLQQQLHLLRYPVYKRKIQKQTHGGYRQGSQMAG